MKTALIASFGLAWSLVFAECAGRCAGCREGKVFVTKCMRRCHGINADGAGRWPNRLLGCSPTD